MMKRALLLSLSLVALLLGVQGASAQLSCTPLNQAALMALFSDNASNSSITPANIRSLVCSLMGGPAGTITPNWTTGNFPKFGNSGLANNTTGSYLIDSGIPAAPPINTINCANLLKYGGVADATITNGVASGTDNSAAWIAALAASTANRPCVYAPAGKYLFNSMNTVTLPAGVASFNLQGDGRDVTQFIWPAGNAITVNLANSDNSFHISDISLLTGAAGMVAFPATTTALHVVATGYNNYAFSALNDITRVTFGGTAGYQLDTAHYWGNAVRTDGVNNINFISDIITGGNTNGLSALSGGDGVVLNGTIATTFAVVFNFTSCIFDGLRNGIIAGNGVQGITVNQSNFTSGFTGIGVPPSETGVDQIAITNSQFGFLPFSIDIQSFTADVLLSNNLFFVPAGGVGVFFAPYATARTILRGNVFAGITSLMGTGVVSGTPSIIDANFFDGLLVGISLSGTGHKAQGNKFPSGTVTPVINVGGCCSTITGLPDKFATISAIADNGSGIMRATVNNTTGLVSSEYVSIGGVGGLPGISVVTAITVVDSTHVDFPFIAFAAGYTSGGIISSMP